MPGANTTVIELGGVELVLSAMRAVYWPAERLLILADLHLGKTGYFRKHGIPVSSNLQSDDLARLGKLIEQFQPEQILVAGDLFHHQLNNDILAFAEWRNQYTAIDFGLVPGNHDKHLGLPYSQLGITVLPEIFSKGGITFLHEMTEPLSSSIVISGHVHPGYRVNGKARQSAVLPCFIVKKRALILPAFSVFTGLFTGYGQAPGDAYYIISEEKIYRF